MDELDAFLDEMQNVIQKKITYDIAIDSNVKLYLLNSPVITGDGNYIYRTISIDEAKEILQMHLNANTVINAIGHESTIRIFNTVFNTDFPVNRITIQMKTLECALVFKLKARPPEGKVLTADEIEQIGYEFGLLVKLQ